MLNRVLVYRSICRPASPFAPCLEFGSQCANRADRKPADCNLASIRRSINLLLVSNDSDFCVLVRSYLQYSGFCVFTCASSARAETAFLKRRDIDLWLIDVEAMGVEGMNVAIEVRDLHPEVPIILFSATIQQESSLQRLFWCNWIQMRKPIDLPNLLATMHRSLSYVTNETRVKRQAGDLDSFEDEESEWEVLFRTSKSPTGALN